MTLSEASLAILGCPPDLEEPAPAVNWLTRAVERQGQNGAAWFVAVNTKFKAPSGLRTINVGTNYPAELALLATHANWTKADELASKQYRDAQALFCLHQFAQAHPDVDRIVLLVEEPGEDSDLATLLETSPARSFHWLASDAERSSTMRTGPIVFNRTAPYSDTALDMALGIALTGAIFSLEPYGLGALLDQSVDAAAVVARTFPAGKD